MTKTQPRPNRSAVTSGARTHVARTDGRTVEGRRFADLLHAVETERGGRAAMSITQQEAARQYAALTVAMERMHAELAAGRPVDFDALGQLGDRADRQARRMGPPKAAARKSILDRLTGAA